MLDFKPKTKIEIQAEKQQEFKHIGHIVMVKGLTLYQMNLETMEVEPVILTGKKAVGIDGKTVQNKKATYNPNCMYFQALNMKVAKRKAFKILEKLSK